MKDRLHLALPIFLSAFGLLALYLVLDSVFWGLK